ncbi:UDP-glycosyltransferase 72E3-like [Neltuma alba]|uniref:UDP-glycosyltransferase 72E3-like n=1 Tax=Neltuma alba TaxID=207710 RepID=UPI0010A3D48E|nr:UDP-glycosyltransferase 72E3-like [Prosopis alba]
MGHLIPMLELGKRLISHHGFEVTIFVVTVDSPTTHSQIIQQASNPKSTGLNVVVLPPVDVSSRLGALNSQLGTRIRFTMDESLPLLRSAILSMKVLPIALIVDMFGTNAFTMARDLKMLRFVFFTSSAWVLALHVNIPIIHKEQLDRHVKHHEPLQIPGCKPVKFEDTMEPLLLKDEPMVFEGFMKMCTNTADADGILVNTWQELEPTTLKALLSGEAIRGKIYPVGPLVRGINSNRTEKDHDLVLSWLDRQPAESVIFVSFGSGGTMSEAQMEEIAHGLELGQQRFIWVVRPPHKEKNHGSYFRLEYGENNRDSVLEKFLSRTHELGLVVPMWAPQSEILEHSSVGAFLTHCGWNSTFEAITNGVPMIAWPLYAEQKMNAAALTEEMGVAVRVKRGGNKAEVVKREEIQRLIRRVMVEEEGVCMRERVKKLQRSAKMALSEAGSSFDSIYQLANYCKFHIAVTGPLHAGYVDAKKEKRKMMDGPLSSPARLVFSLWFALSSYSPPSSSCLSLRSAASHRI